MGPSYGGPFQTVRKLAQAQVMAGQSVSVRMPWSSEAEAHRGDWAPVDVSVSGEIILPAFGWSPAYGRELLACRADLLHTHGIWQYPSWAAIAWKKRWRQPHVCSVRGMLEPWAWQHHAWKKRPVWWLWEKRNLESASLLHATSEQEAQSFRDRGLTAPIAIIPNGVDLALMPSEGLKVQGRMSREPKTALFLSRIHPKKGLPLLLEAWARLKPAGWRLKIVGPDEGGHRAELERQVALLGLADGVRFSGPLTGTAKETAFRDSDLFVLPTHSENFGIAVAEAMAHGLPVIITHGAPWRMVEEESCGWWVPVSVDGIAAALDDATRKSPGELSAMGERGRAVVAKRFAWDKIAGEMIGCYRWVLGEGTKPGCVLD
jgi:glycosyltransferase involved in cell wall biosynthesis